MELNKQFKKSKISSCNSDKSFSGSNLKVKRPIKNPWGNLSYSQLIEKAIEHCTLKYASLKDIYNWFIMHEPYFREKSNSKGWKVK